MRRNTVMASRFQAVSCKILCRTLKPYFSRKPGNEANTQLNVYAAKMLPVVDVSRLSKDAVRRLEAAFDALEDRPVTGLVEERLLVAQNWDSLTDCDAEPRDVPEENSNMPTGRIGPRWRHKIRLADVMTGFFLPDHAAKPFGDCVTPAPLRRSGRK